MPRPLSSSFAKPIALAAAALCLSYAPARAQSVNLYGLIDVSAGQFQDAGAPKLKRVESGKMTTSYFGFSGKEELSSTLKAKFAIEGFFGADTGASGRFGGDVFWARSAYVGLEGDFGSTVLGRTTNQYFVSTLIFNAFGDSFGYSPSIRQVLTPKAAMLPFLGDTGWSNSLLYSSPKLGGLSLNLQGALGEGSSTTTGHSFGGNAIYFGGPFAATVAYQRVKHGVFGTLPALITTGFKYQESATVGASYDLTVVKFFAQYNLVKTEAATDTETHYFGLGASAPVGPGKVLAQYGQATAEYPTADVENKTLTLGYDYLLSKRTDVYAVFMHDKLTGAANGNTFVVGLRHRF
ncbi:porin [Piscinibacter sp. HJYY11]|uniref:porin n=1 Tax=Piscinibacter sp. HJYY11 TaxID=2801333 RepID=UPI00191E1380|nr:porin [Piscinibacter sp. HJYY11]MBL0728754.1 porin [Piscinibacter sp. HJYY11]